VVTVEVLDFEMPETQKYNAEVCQFLAEGSAQVN
jgi:hypothetical protein